MVHLSSEVAATSILKSASLLRRSDDPVIASSIFVNPDFCPADAKIAYEKRQRKRERQNGEGASHSTIQDSIQDSTQDSTNNEMNLAAQTASTVVAAATADMPRSSSAILVTSTTSGTSVTLAEASWNQNPFSKLSAYMFNARSIVNKICELHDLLYTASYDMYFISETWLHSGICSGLLDPNQQYTVLRSDCNVSRGGGVCAFIHKNIRTVPVSIDDVFCDVDLLSFDAIIENTHVRFFVIYRPSKLDGSAVNYMSKLVKCLNKYESKKYTNIIVGDLNLPKIDWTNYSAVSQDVYQMFLTFVIEGGYCQLVSQRTRDSAILDVVLTTDPLMFTVVETDMPFSTSDHLCVKFDMVFASGRSCLPSSPSSSSSLPVKYKWYEGDYDAIESYLFNIDWYSLLYFNPSVQAVWDTFMSVLYAVIDMYVPHLKHTKSSARHVRHPSRALSKCTTKKRRLWHYLKSNPYDSRAHANYHDCVQQWRRLVKQHEYSTEENIIDANNLGAFYRFVNKRISNRCKISAVKNSAGDILTTKLDIANAFNDYFASVGVASNDCIPQFLAINVPQLTSIDITVQDVLAVINKLKANLSAVYATTFIF